MKALEKQIVEILNPSLAMYEYPGGFTAYLAVKHIEYLKRAQVNSYDEVLKFLESNFSIAAIDSSPYVREWIKEYRREDG